MLFGSLQNSKRWLSGSPGQPMKKSSSLTPSVEHLFTKAIRKLKQRGIVPSWVNRAIVVSLPSCNDRRERLKSYLPANGIHDYTFFDAYGPHSVEVRRLYESGAVKTFPDCFRCGDLTCGKDDCNNVLIPPQVANVVTFRKLWAEIAYRGEVTLIMEDDIVLHKWAASTFARLDKAVKTGTLRLGKDHCGLIRLGWAEGADHDKRQPFRLTTDLRMSNPMHIITPDFAERLASLPEPVMTTSDITLHRVAPKPGQAVTVLPPIASELSWSTGTTPSTIHPKSIHVDHLKAMGEDEAAQVYEEKVKAHRNHIYYRPILITGHPRTGTGFAADLCRQVGLDVGHETNGKHGLASWMMAANAEENPWFQHPIARSRLSFHSDTIIQTVRDPITALASIMREDKYAPKSLTFRAEHIKKNLGIELSKCQTPADRACMSLCLWAKMIGKPDHVFRIEDGVEGLISFLRGRGLPVKTAIPTVSLVNADKLYKGERKPKPEFPPDKWASLEPSTKFHLACYCDTYGYALPPGV